MLKRASVKADAAEPNLQGRDRIGHGKRRRKRRPSKCMAAPIGECHYGDIRHVSARNLGRKPKKRHDTG